MEGLLEVIGHENEGYIDMFCMLFVGLTEEDKVENFDNLLKDLETQKTLSAPRNKLTYIF